MNIRKLGGRPPQTEDASAMDMTGKWQIHPGNDVTSSFNKAAETSLPGMAPARAQHKILHSDQILFLAESLGLYLMVSSYYSVL